MLQLNLVKTDTMSSDHEHNPAIIWCGFDEVSMGEGNISPGQARNYMFDGNAYHCHNFTDAAARRLIILVIANSELTCNNMLLTQGRLC